MNIEVARRAMLSHPGNQGIHASAAAAAYSTVLAAQEAGALPEERVHMLDMFSFAWRELETEFAAVLHEVGAEDPQPATD